MTILGQTPRIVIASLLAYWVGSFSNSYILALMKVWTGGRWLWTRTIGSTLVGELLDSTIFVTVAFGAVLPSHLVLELIVFNYIFKTAVEIAFTPLTYWVISFLKRNEHVDFFDKKTNFNPFTVK
jgi:queuosine precursor transporter